MIRWVSRRGMSRDFLLRLRSQLLRRRLTASAHTLESLLNSEHDSACNAANLLIEFANLWAEVDALWQCHQDAPAFHNYVSADYQAVYDSLVQLQGRALTALEWGSGLGVVTIMASRMGFEAYGIEAEAGLVEFSEGLAQGYGPKAQFTQGSFFPEQFRWNPTDRDRGARTVVDAEAAYGNMKMELRDFDLIYSYPFPKERALYHQVLREFARPDAFFLCFDVRTGTHLSQVQDL